MFECPFEMKIFNFDSSGNGRDFLTVLGWLTSELYSRFQPRRQQFYFQSLIYLAASRIMTAEFSWKSSVPGKEAALLSKRTKSDLTSGARKKKPNPNKPQNPKPPNL